LSFEFLVLSGEGVTIKIRIKGWRGQGDTSWCIYPATRQDHGEMGDFFQFTRQIAVRTCHLARQEVGDEDVAMQLNIRERRKRSRPAQAG
jgi:hypothetical protein